MSRSYKKSPVVSPGSSKLFNSQANRRLRRAVRTRLHVSVVSGADLDALVLPVAREISDLWDGPKDGRCNMFDVGPDDDFAAELVKLMRK